MRVLKESSYYLKRKAAQHLILAVLCLVGLAGISLTSVSSLPLYIDLSRYEGVRAVSLGFPLILGLYFIRRARNYKQGLNGENFMAKLLISDLDERYYLLNDITFLRGNGNIDHIVLGPNGFFVIETKSNAGKIICHGDLWTSGSRLLHRNPSRQAKDNATSVQKVITVLKEFQARGIWVEPIVAFANYDAKLETQNPATVTLMAHRVPDFIRNYKRYSTEFSTQELETIGKEILARC